MGSSSSTGPPGASPFPPQHLGAGFLGQVYGRQHPALPERAGGLCQAAGRDREPAGGNSQRDVESVQQRERRLHQPHR